MKLTNRHIYFALSLCGVDVRKVSLSAKPLLCRDPDTTPEYHSHINGCSWSITDKDSGIVQRSGRVTLGGRVTEFKAGNQQVLPFGGSWTAAAETLYRFQRWDFFNGVG